MPKVSQNKGEVSQAKSEETLTGMSLLLLPSIDIEEAIDICIVAWLLWPDEESTYTPTLEQVKPSINFWNALLVFFKFSIPLMEDFSLPN